MMTSPDMSACFADPRAIIAAGRRALKPPPLMSLSEWADEKFRLSADAGSAEPGRWKTKPVQRGWMNAMTDPAIEQVTVMKSTRVGYTETIKAYIGYHVDYDPCPVMVIQPTDDDAKGFAKESIDPLLRDCPSVGERFGSRGKDTLTLRRFRGGVLDIVGARSPGNFRRKSRRVILGDECDGYPASAGDEGDPIALARKRAESFWNRKLVLGSTPRNAGTSRIEQEFFAGDQRRLYVPCPHCHDTHPDRGMQVLQFGNMRWPSGRPDLAVFICVHCGCEIEHEHKLWMLERVEDRPGPHAQFPDDPAPNLAGRHHSVHVWSAYSDLPNTTWGEIASEFVKANAAGPEQLKTWVNTWAGETWRDKGEAPEWKRLYDRREAYAIGTCPAGVRFLTAAVDVQRNRLVWEVVGWGRGKESWSIDAGVVPGDTSDLTQQGPWPQIDALLDRAFEHERGAELRIRMLAVDTGDQTQTCYEYVRSKDSGRVIAVKGNDSASVLVSIPTKVDVSVSGKRVGELMLWRVGGPLAKGELYGWLKLEVPTDEEFAAGAVFPPGFCHFPEHGEEFFKQLTAEQLVTHRTKQGFTIREWQVVADRENHFLDARVYARAAASVVGLDRFKESDWLALERMLGHLAERRPDEKPVIDALREGVRDAAATAATRHPSQMRGRRVSRSTYLNR